MILNPYGAVGTGVPAGVVCMWSGTQADIPDGWALCDGQDGRPDLRGRFIVGAGGDYAAGATGGAAMVTLSLDQMPEHSHGGAVTIEAAGNHRHEYNQGGTRPAPTGSGNAVRNAASKGVQTGDAGEHEHSASLSIESAGGGAAHENLPPYFALCFIIKIN